MAAAWVHTANAGVVLPGQRASLHQVLFDNLLLELQPVAVGGGGEQIRGKSDFTVTAHFNPSLRPLAEGSSRGAAPRGTAARVVVQPKLQIPAHEALVHSPLGRLSLHWWTGAKGAVEWTLPEADELEGSPRGRGKRRPRGTDAAAEEAAEEIEWVLYGPRRGYPVGRAAHPSAAGPTVRRP